MRQNASGAPALAVENVTVSYGALRANDDVSLTVGAGEVVALLGENGAGKSTLVKALAGVVRPDSGGVSVAGAPLRLGDPVRSRKIGIGVVHQHFMLVPDMTVAENVVLSRGFDGGRGVDLDGVGREIHELGSRLGLEVRTDVVVDRLPVGERQRVEILKTLLLQPHVLVLDEPSAVLTPGEWARLAEVIRDLAANGYAIVLITHKLAEIMDIADRCVVMRGGQVVGDVTVAHSSARELAELMVGRDVDLAPARADVDAGPTVLRVSGLSLLGFRGQRDLGPVDLCVAGGEILGIAGVEGNGQAELAEMLAGQRESSSGSIEVRTRAGEAGGTIGVVSEDRHKDALALPLSVEDNLMMRTISQSRFHRHGVLRRRAIREHCGDLVGRFDIRTSSTETSLSQLSGGNQQKVVLARELEDHPDLLIASQPTRGLDVGAIEFVHAQINEHKRSGGATVLISAELEEVLGMSDRVAVMSDGQIVDVLPASEATREVVGRLMAGAAEEVA
ncbi:ABC transporter ATP-binding protein [Pseudactinotalea sp.]|uniref:ABC transporter ATP-binding protein n=1 Tax=Pseudactinotalea sp. TaxID=1926260 RepID=UPI003B3A9F8D